MTDEFDRREVAPFETFDGWVEWCSTYLTGVGRKAGRKLADFPALMLATNGAGLVVVMNLSEYLGSEEDKDKLGYEVMPGIIRAVEATRFAWATSAWMGPGLDDPLRAEFDAWHAGRGPGLEGGPGVREVVNVVFGEWTGEQAMRSAPIFRVRKGTGKFLVGPLVDPYADAGKPPAWNWLTDDCLSGRLVDDSMRAVIGGPTENELKAAAWRVSKAAPARDVILAAMVDVMAEMDAEEARVTMEAWEAEDGGELVEAFMVKVGAKLALDEDRSRVLRDLIDAEIGPLSPLRTS